MTQKNAKTTQVGPLAEAVWREQERIERCAADPDYPTAYERGVILARLEGDEYLHKQMRTVFATLDHLRRVVLRNAVGEAR